MSAAAAKSLLHVFSTFATGGAQVRFATLANHFGAAYRHAIIAMDGDTSCSARLDPALDVVFPPLLARKHDTLGNLRRIRRVLRALRPDVLVTSNWGTMEWAMANRLPHIRHIHMEDGFGPEEQSRQLPRRVWLRRLFLRRSTMMLPSRTLFRIATEIWRLDPRRLRYIPNGIDLARFAAAAPERPDGTVVIGTVAALRPEKNLARLLRAFRLVADTQQARLVIVGNGAERGALTALAGDLGLADRVDFAGYRADPAPCYGGFDIFALSSDTEQMPLSVLEAMAAGLPIAATDVGDVRAMLAEANAPFITTCEDAALAASLRALLADRAGRRAVGAANRAKAERDYDQQVMFRAWRRLLDGKDEEVSL
jgi:glycosyltransferase involved in cell wall biosynthesis